MFKKLIHIIPLIPKLGYRNAAYMAWYRFSMKLGFRKRMFPRGESIQGIYFDKNQPVNNYPEQWKVPLKNRADEIVDGTLTWFFKHKMDIGSPPEWFRNPFDSISLKTPNKHWTELGDYDLNTGDVKILWEPSRFYWLTCLARAYKVFGDEKYLETMNLWLNDWSENNPLNTGPNWKCGQETSIRIIQLVNSAKILNQHEEATETICRFIHDHLRRVEGNLGYAIAQDNNHGTSEGAGLLIGGAFLLKNSDDPAEKSDAQNAIESGRKLLEDRVDYLIAEDGSFSQHSVNYHRLLVDTLATTEYWRQQFGLAPMTRDFYKKADKALTWLERIADPESGHAPNLGANDGAMLMNIHSCDYTDFRPSIQLARVVFNRYCRFESGSWDEPLFWLEQRSTGLPVKHIQKLSCNLDNRYQILKGKRGWAVIKLPGFPFRPAQNDTFHFDFWIDGVNIACDAGSYSYYEPESIQFSSVQAHNTIQFNGHEPMPKISRFLHSHWLKPANQEMISRSDDIVHWKGEYVDFRKNKHKREVISGESYWEIRDQVQSEEDEIFLRWHLPYKKENVTLQNNKVMVADFEIEFTPGVEIKLQESKYARYYLYTKEGTQLTIRLPESKTIVTKWTFKQV